MSIRFLLLISICTLMTSYSAALPFTVTATNSGPTPFIRDLVLSSSNLSSLQGITFTIYPKRGSSTRAISASYSLNYLQSRGYINGNQLTIPVFGLYQNYTNTIKISWIQKNSGKQNLMNQTINSPSTNVIILNPAYTSDDSHTHPIVLKSRITNTTLSYDYILIKNWNTGNTPVVVDTDGEVRWVGTSGVGTHSALLYKNGIYISDNGSSLIRQEWDGAFTTIENYSEIGVTDTEHHNFDYGKFGMILDVNTTGTTECVNIEVGTNGVLLNEFNFAAIIRNALLEGGEDPGAVSAFIGSPSKDWFHNNAIAYNRNDDSIISSSRENFVICVDYNTRKIKWILGDTTKAWYQSFQALRKYALTLPSGSLPPIGQHSVSITSDGGLLLFDDGLGSFNNSPSGDTRSYSAPRKYTIDLSRMTAIEVWHYYANPSIWSSICSSVYEDAPNNYLIDYANESGGPELRGLDSKGTLVFDFQYAGNYTCGWNAMPIHMENITFP
jgi:arylsulfate sulfotransferase